MTAALAIALLARQAPSVRPPSLPLGTSPEFAKIVMDVESHLAEGDVAGARAAAKALPVRQPRLAWADDAALPAALRKERPKGLADAVLRWNVVAKDFAPVVGDGPADVTIGFAPALPDGPDGLPLSARVDSRTPFRATIGLTLGKPGVPLRADEMNMRVAYALGRYLGVPESPLPGSSMHLDGHPGLATYWPRPDDWVIAAQNLAFADRVRTAVAAGKPLGIAPPVVHLAKERLDLGTVDQGRLLPGAIEAENLGAGPLDYAVVRDCSCFEPIPDGQVAPQGRKEVRFRIATREYTGRIEKLLLFRSNDPERPTIEVPVTFFSRPAYRIVHPGGDRVTVPPGGATYDLFFFTPPGSALHFVKAGWDGVAAKVSQEPWSGSLADPDMGEETALPRTGWRFHVKVPANLPPGRPTGTLTLRTDSREFPYVTSTLTFQRGIVADEANFGEFGLGDRASLLVDRPGTPFRVKKADAGPFMTAKVVERRGGWEYRIDLEYKGGAAKGDFLGKVRLVTDDPKQPVVETLVHGYVK